MALGDIEIAAGSEGGGGLAATIASFSKTIDDAIAPVMGFADGISNSLMAVTEFGGVLGKTIGYLGTQLVDQVTSYFKGQFQGLADKIVNPIVDVIKAVFDPIFEVLSVALEPFVSTMKTLGAVVGLVMMPFTNLVKLLGVLLKPLELAADLFNGLSDQVNGLIDGVFDPLMKMIEAPFKVLGALISALLMPLRALEYPLQWLANEVEMLAKMFESAMRSLEGPMKAFSSIQSKAHDVMNDVMDTIEQVVSDPVGGFNAIIDTISKFVEAVDPNVIQLLQNEMRQLFAIIGEALQPVMYVAVEVLKQFNAALRPVLQELAPMIKELANNIGGYLLQLLPEMADYLRELIPVIREYVASQVQAAKDNMAMLKTYNTLKDAMQNAIRPIIEFVKSLMPASKGNMSLIQSLSKLTIVISAFAAKMMGLNQMFDDIRNSFKRTLGDTEKSRGAVMAAQNPTTKMGEDLGRDAMMSAFIAVGGNDGAERALTESEFYKEVTQSLDAMAEMSWFDLIKEGVYAALKKIAEDSPAIRGGSSLLNFATNQLDIASKRVPI